LWVQSCCMATTWSEQWRGSYRDSLANTAKDIFTCFVQTTPPY
jgi:hypothetical protein